MNPEVPGTARLEIKFVTYNIYLYNILQWLRMHSSGFIRSYPDRRVNNIYFDTHECGAFADNIAGVSSRTKIRYRWYGISDMPDSGRLEIKHKRNCYGWKVHFNVPASPYIHGADWHGIRRLLADQLPEAGKKWLQENPVPVLINRYYRRYFISGDRKIRVTIDTDQEVLEQRFRAYPNFTGSAYKNDIIIIEFKFDRAHRDIAAEVLRGIPARQSRHSKYVMGVRATSGI